MTKARDGTIVEVFEWRDEWRDGATVGAQRTAQVQVLWAEDAAVSDYLPLEALPETSDFLATFAPL